MSASERAAMIFSPCRKRRSSSSIPFAAASALRRAMLGRSGGEQQRRAKTRSRAEVNAEMLACLQHRRRLFAALRLGDQDEPTHQFAAAAEFAGGRDALEGKAGAAQVFFGCFQQGRGAMQMPAPAA